LQKSGFKRGHCLYLVMTVEIMISFYINSFQQYFSYIVTFSFIGGGHRNTQRNHRPVTSHWQTWSHNVVSSTLRHEWDAKSQLWCGKTLIAQVVVNSSIIRPQQPFRIKIKYNNKKKLNNGMNNVVNELCFINVMTNNKYKNVKIVIQKYSF
jgi:hypothetical protein